MAHHVEPGLRHLGLVLQAAMVKRLVKRLETLQEKWKTCGLVDVFTKWWTITYIYIHILYIDMI